MAEENTAMLNKRKPTAEIKATTIDLVQSRVEELVTSNQLHFPANYSAANALQSAWLQIQEIKDSKGNLALLVCTRESIANALFNTVVQGLSPAKKQVYYVIYGDQLQAVRSYFGTMAVAKRLQEVKDICVDVVYEGDTFEAHKENGTWVIDKHDSKVENIDPDKITAAYCIIEKADGSKLTEIMNMKQIEKSWSRSKTQRGVHKDFPDQMAKRTVINRACKILVNTSDDSDLLIEAFNASGGGIMEDVSNRPEPEADKGLDALNETLQKAIASRSVQDTTGAIDVDPVDAEAEQETPQEGESNEQLCIN